MTFVLKTAFLPAVALLAACQPAAPETANSAQTVAAAQASLLARHDSAMAQTSRLRDLKDQLGQRPDGVAYVRSLDGADQAMMRWMNGYVAPDATKPAAAQLVYFQGQQAKLAAVEARIQSALDSAQLLVGKR